jgi:hypothetical protein
MSDLSGKSSDRRMDRRLSLAEARLRALEEAWNRQAPKASGTQGVVPRLTKFDITRTEDMLQVGWGAVTMPDLRYYEVQIDRHSDFRTPEITIQTPNPFATFTTGFGMIGFYFYVRARAVSNDRRVGPWTPKVETPSPSEKTLNPSSGVLQIPRRADSFPVGGSATTITDIRGGWVGRFVTLYFTVAHTVQDNTRIRLTSNFTATVPSTLSLRYMGDTLGWAEVARTGTL